MFCGVVKGYSALYAYSHSCGSREDPAMGTIAVRVPPSHSPRRDTPGSREKKPSHIQWGGLEGVGVCIGVPAKQGQPQDTTGRHSQKRGGRLLLC